MKQKLLIPFFACLACLHPTMPVSAESVTQPAAEICMISEDTTPIPWESESPRAVLATPAAARHEEALPQAGVPLSSDDILAVICLLSFIGGISLWFLHADADTSHT